MSTSARAGVGCCNRVSLHRIAGVVLLLGLSVESLAVTESRTTVPLTSLLASGFFPWLVVVRSKWRSGPVTRSVVGFAGFALIHSLIALAVEFAINGDMSIRLVAWFRQVTALASGVVVYLVFRQVIPHLSDRTVAGGVIAGALPTLFLGFLSLAWGLLGLEWAGRMLVEIVDVLPIHGYASASRASGLSMEPAHLAIFLATVVLPVLVSCLPDARSRIIAVMLLGWSATVFIWTFSLTGAIVLAASLLPVLQHRTYRRRVVSLVIASVLILGVITTLKPNNYLWRQTRASVAAFRTGDLSYNASIADTVYSTFGPLMRTPTSLVVLGYGLGGTSTHFDEVIPTEGVRVLRSVKWSDHPNLGTMVGRVYAETGLLGFWLFVLIWVQALRLLARLERYTVRSIANASSLSLRIIGARMGIIGTTAALTVKIGSFALPYMWFWLAFVEARFEDESRRSGFQ